MLTGNAEMFEHYINGKRINKKTGEEYKFMPLPKLFAPLFNSGIKVSSKCCGVMKEQPLNRYMRASGASPVRKHRAYLRISDRRHGGGRAEREVDYMAACEARRAGLLARFLYAFGYRIDGDAWRENRRPRLR